MAAKSPARRSGWSPWFDWGDLRGMLDWPSFSMAVEADRLLRIEEERDGDTLVVRAEMPGIDPDKDVDVKVHDHTLEIRAERHEERSDEENGSRRSEFRYGSFFRAISLPPDAKSGDVRASYRDGVLEVRIPCTPAAEAKPTRIPVERA